MEETLLDSSQVAAALHVSRSLVYYRVKTGDLPCIRIGNTIRVHPRDLAAFIRSRETLKHPPKLRSRSASRRRRRFS